MSKGPLLCRIENPCSDYVEDISEEDFTFTQAKGDVIGSNDSVDLANVSKTLGNSLHTPINFGICMDVSSSFLEKINMHSSKHS